MDLLAKIKEMNKAKKTLLNEALGKEQGHDQSVWQKPRKADIKDVKAKIIQCRIRELLERQRAKRAKQAELIKHTGHPMNGSKYSRLLYATPHNHAM